MPEIVRLPDVTNRELVERHAAPGRVGLAGGSALVDRVIRRAEGRLQRPDRTSSRFSHALLFTGRRVDGHHWVAESDLDVGKKHVRLGAQENRADRLFDEADYPHLAILDFGLTDEQAVRVVTAALDLVAGQARYSLRELAGTLLSLARPSLRSRTNLLAREGSLYCSAFVQACYEAVGIDFAPGIHLKNTTPEDLATTAVPHTAYLR